MKKFILTALAALAALSAIAKVELTPLFTDNMVFQQNTQAPVWGKAAPGATVKVTPSWNNKTYTATAVSDGRWEVRIPTPKGSFKKYTLTISDGTPVTLHFVTSDMSYDREWTVSSFPDRANFTGLTQPTGTLTLTYTVATAQTSTIDPETGEERITPASTETREQRRSLTFTPED